MSKLMVSDNKETMTSLEFLEKVINPSRVENGESEVRSNVFFHRVVDELDLDPSTCKEIVYTSELRNRTYTAKGFDLDKDQMMLVGMRESKAVRKSVLSKLKELSDRDKPSIPQTYAEALQLAADQAKQLELAAPKVAFVDNLVERTNLMNATQVAQKHGKSARWLNSKLDDMDVFNKSVKRVRVFKQWFIDSGLGQMKKTEMGYDQPLFTNRGEVWISERLSCDGEI